jgi:hypothetical protein
MDIQAIRRVLVVGAGTMGQHIGFYVYPDPAYQPPGFLSGDEIDVPAIPPK